MTEVYSKPPDETEGLQEIIGRLRFELSVPTNLQNSGFQLAEIITPILDEVAEYLRDNCKCK